jgi:hypothetical protein
VDIEQFYDEDPRRRASAEVEYGRDWHDAAGNRYEASWVADTGELYVMGEPPEAGGLDAFGDWFAAPMSPHAITVRVLTRVADRESVETALAGWERAMAEPDSTAWLVTRLRDAGLALDMDADPDTRSGGGGRGR